MCDITRKKKVSFYYWLSEVGLIQVFKNKKGWYLEILALSQKGENLLEYLWPIMLAVRWYINKSLL